MSRWIRRILEKIFFPGPQLEADPAMVAHVQPLNRREKGILYRCYVTPTTKKSDRVILFSHANGESIDTIILDCIQLVEVLGCDLISWEYPGYNDGTPGPTTEENVNAAAMIILEMASSRYEKIYVWGQSIGSTPACAMAASENPKIHGLILHNAYTAIMDVHWMNDYIPLRFFFDALNNLEQLHRVHSPSFTIYIFHAREDEMVPITHALHMKEECEHMGIPVVLQILDGYTHNDSIRVEHLQELKKRLFT